ncbi:hypothetical protein ACJJTC_001910 [Scirpophaga incertulas]
MIRPTTLLAILLTIWVLTHSTHGHAKTFTRCQLSKELTRYNFPRLLIPHWVCLIEHGSSRTTDKVTEHGNSTSYGLFQINSNEWCKKGRKGGNCNMKCEDLLNEDLADDVRCAKRINDRVGFNAWPVYITYCKDRRLPELTRC